MGIHGLMPLLREFMPQLSKDKKITLSYFKGRKVAIDASMWIYQFLTAMSKGGSYSGGHMMTLTDSDGNSTTHLVGLWNRTMRMLEAGMKPVYVFDGKAPELKNALLASRREKAAEARKKLERAVAEGDVVAVDKLAQQTIRMNDDHVNDCKKMLTLMGIPVVQAPTEADSQIAELVRGGKVYCAGTEDMDQLTFGTSVMVRYMIPSANPDRRKPTIEIRLEEVLSALELTMDQFIDLCILMGCDYAPKTISGIGGSRAYQLIREYGSIEKIIPLLDADKYKVPAYFPFQAAREAFKNPEVTPCAEVGSLGLKKIQVEELKKFMIEEKNFDEAKIERGIATIKGAKGKKDQKRLGGFFKVKRKAASGPMSAKAAKLKKGSFAKTIMKNKNKRK